MPADNRVLLLDMRMAERGRLAASISRLGYVAILAEDMAATQATWEREAVPIVIVDIGEGLPVVALVAPARLGTEQGRVHPQRGLPAVAGQACQCLQDGGERLQGSRHV